MRLFVLAAALASLAAPAVAAGDPAQGEAVFKKCMACHAVGDNAKNKVGPVLNGVIGRTAGTLEGYKYSQAMIDAGAAGTVWDEVSLTTFLADPKALVKGTKMAFFGLKQPEDIANVIAYLETFSDEE